MVGTPTLRAAVAATGLLAALVALAGIEESAVAEMVGRAGANRAVVVVDDGVTRTEACVFFPGTIDGIEALERSGIDAVLSGFGGMGSAVCAIGGVGCSASSCLTCQAPKFWHYLRAEAGASSFTTSPLGAGSAKVEDGDVEAWVWGISVTPPPLPSVDEVCGPRVTTTTATARPSPTTTLPARPDLGGPRPTTVLSLPPPGGIPPPTVPDPVATLPTFPAATAEPGTTTTSSPTHQTGGSTTTSPGGSLTDPPEGDAEGEVSGDASERPTADDAGSSREQALAAPGSAPGNDEDGAGTGGWLGVGAVVVLLAGLATWATVLKRRTPT